MGAFAPRSKPSPVIPGEGLAGLSRAQMQCVSSGGKPLNATAE